MKISIQKITDWKLVLDAARWTVNKQGIDKEPSDSFKRKILISEHSPIRELRFMVEIVGLPNFASQQISRHDNFVGHSHRTGSTDQNYVGTNRSDRKDVKDEEVHRLTPVDHKISLSAADFIELSKKRLCYGCASTETRESWEIVIEELAKIEPELAFVCIPTCIYRGFCSEDKDCNYINTTRASKKREEYINFHK